MTPRTDLETAPIDVRFDHLLALIGSQRFLKMQGLGNEVPFFICPFAPAETVAMQRLQKNLIAQLRAKGVQVLEVNLYDLVVELLTKRGIWDRIVKEEPSRSRDQIMGLLQGVLDPETHLVPAIAARMDAAPCEVLFITGVGEVFPYIRSHKVLNNLQSTAKNQPTVMFFPGTYTMSLESGASLDLFGRMHDDRYYRAFNIYHCEI